MMWLEPHSSPLPFLLLLMLPLGKMARDFAQKYVYSNMPFFENIIFL